MKQSTRMPFDKRTGVLGLLLMAFQAHKIEANANEAQKHLPLLEKTNH
ncbi:MAG: hypothetical protein QM296_09145 [Bacillota bacterium]|nr:hypothetical protein [Bacillota bacterium]